MCRIFTLVISLCAGISTCACLEMPRFNSLGKFTPPEQVAFEVRHYEPAVAIETETSEKERGGAFMRLAGYIGVGSSPQNTRKEGISMTSPVVSSMNLDSKSPMTDMQFVLPQSLFGGNVDKAPVPSSADVHVMQRPARNMAVYTFNGSWSESEYAEKVKQLCNSVEKMQQDDSGFGWKVKLPLVSETYRYNSPWTLAFMRTNEVAVELEKKTEEAQ